MPTLEEIYKDKLGDYPFKDALIKSPEWQEYLKNKQTDIDNGVYSSSRHYGQFSSNNPYFAQLQHAKGQDADALYEMAVKWEADRQALEEQRAYDSPAQQVARQRAAGINPDLAGAGSGGMSSGSSATMPQQSNTTEFASQYRENELRTQRLSVISSMLSSASSFISSVSGGITSLAQLPAMLKVGAVQADVAERSADSVVQQNQNSAESGRLQNIQSQLSMLSQLQTFFTPQSTDEDYNTVLSTLGFAGDEIGPMRDSLRQYMTNPAYQNWQESTKRSLQANQAYNNTHTPAILGELSEFALQYQRAQNDFVLTRQNIQNGVIQLLDNQEYINSLATGEKLSSIGQNTQMTYDIKLLGRDISAYTERLSHLKNASSFYQNLIDDTQAKIDKLGHTTPELNATLWSLKYRQMELQTLGSAELQDMYSLLQQAQYQYYMNNRNITSDGELFPVVVGQGRINTFTDYTFMRYLNDVSSDADKTLTGSITKFLPPKIQAGLELIK